MADRVVGPYIQRRKLLMNSPRVYEKILHFARADRDVRPYNVNS